MHYTYDNNSFSDLYKDAHSVRPRGDHPFYAPSVSRDEKQMIWDNMISSLEAAIEEEREAESDAIDWFERQIDDMMSLYSSPCRSAAIRWIADSHGAEDPEDLIHRLRIPYSEYGVEITTALEEA